MSEDLSSPIDSPRAVVSPRPGLTPHKATIKRNSATWDQEHFNILQNGTITIETWARLVSTNSLYPNVAVAKDEIIFGRREDADVLIKDGAISNTHCRVWRVKADDSKQEESADSEDVLAGLDRVYVQDLSTNGTFIKDQRVGKGNIVSIQSGTEIVLIPRGKNRAKVSFIIYIPKHEEQETAPSGDDVTFVFTDIQGSTTLWEACPDAMDKALKRHDHLLRKLLRKYNGYEVKTEGDAFMVAFFNALDALMWCAAVQKALLESQWPNEFNEQPAAKLEVDANGHKIFSGIRVRMGLHTGKCSARRNPVTGRMDYYGQPVNRAARVSDSGHGGQIVCTEQVKNAYEEKKATATEYGNLIMDDLGTHNYKGVPEPVRVFQVIDPELPARRFPPLRTEANRQAKAHKLLPDEKKEYSPTHRDSAGSVNEVVPDMELEQCVCANPGCGKIETADFPFGACARCKVAKYCGVDCQKAHWKAHKPNCKKPPTTILGDL